jgi:Uma2 family endonuclease
MVHAIPDDGNRYELVDGELLVSPAPSLLHQRAVWEFSDVLRAYVKALGTAEMLGAPIAVTLSRRRELQPDLCVLPFVHGRKAGRFEDVGRLLLAVEVLSASTTRNDRYRKRPVYQQEGVPECWLVDPDARLVERWRATDAEPEVLLTTLRWKPVETHEALEIDLEALFREAHGEQSA